MRLSIGDVADIEAINDTERRLLYVACTRARDRLLVTGVRPGTEFLDDLFCGLTTGAMNHNPKGHRRLGI
ncbi:hypothetical protein [Nitrospirillum amazonense]|uniref:hypothetical protein n=1 Tax=Nitrospirillum amazonense TaxID=28077 RepID=UPI001B3BCB56|nr:hypothetical protein [Nitrospirillum amazonense]